MNALILCAGYATRLYPLTKEKPKPLLEIASRPILERILEKIERMENINKIHIITNSKFFFQFLEWAKDYSSKKEIHIINDGTESNDDRLGAIGDIQFSIEKKAIDDDLLIVAGDNLFEFDLDDMRQLFEKKEKTTIALHDVLIKQLASQYGVVEVDSQGRLSHFIEKPKEPKSTLISTGIYMIPRKDLGLIKTYIDEGNSTDKIGSFFEWLHGKDDIYCLPTKEKWYDIGTLDQLRRANEEYRKQ